MNLYSYYNHRSARATLPVKTEHKRVYECVECLDDTNVVHLKNNSKVIYMGHHKFLHMDHPYRRNKKDFDGTVDRRKPLEYGGVGLKEWTICTFAITSGGVEFVRTPHNILFFDYTYPFLMFHLLTIYYNIAQYLKKAYRRDANQFQGCWNARHSILQPAGNN